MIFKPDEEGAVRRAYRAGRSVRYCGNPDRCGSGWRGFIPPLDELNPPIAVD